jgi:hypothetical protein
MVLSEPEEEEVISERNDGGLIYVAETRNQPLFLSLILSLWTDSIKGKANENLVT